MSGDIPKQFRLLNGKPLLAYSLEKFYHSDRDTKIIIALPENHISYWQQLVKEYHFTIPHSTLSGGRERFHSVKNALLSFDHPGSLVAIHDAARPFVSEKLIEKLFLEAEVQGCAIPA